MPKKDVFVEVDAELTKQLILAAMRWRCDWVDEEDLHEAESGCNCSVCKLIRVVEELSNTYKVRK